MSRARRPAPPATEMAASQGERQSLLVAEPPPYPTGRMAFQIVFLMTLGTLYSFSTWSDTFVGSAERPGPFPLWTQAELGFVYSMGIFGGFATPLGGFLYDKLGATPTFFVGVSLVLTGWALMSLVALSSFVPTHLAYVAVGLCYAVEELGSGTLYMGIAMDTLLYFPDKSVSMSMGLVALGYSLSSVVTTLVVRLMHPSLWSIVAFISTVVPMFALARVFVLGAPAVNSPSDANNVKTAAEAAGAGGTSYAQAMSGSQFRTLALFSVLCIAPCTALLGFMQLAGDASGSSGSSLVTIALITNCAGRVLVGFSYDRIRDVLPSTRALLVLEAGMALAFGLLVISCYQQTRQAAILSFGCLSVTMLFGGAAPVIGAYIKDSFEPSTSGFILGASQLVVAFANFGFNSAFGPVEVTHLAGFKKPFLASSLMAVLCAAIHVLELGHRGQSGKAAHTS